MEEETFSEKPENTSDGGPKGLLRGEGISKYIFFSLLGLVLLSGTFCVGYWYGVHQSKIEPLKPAIPTPTLAPLPTPTPTTPVEDETTDWKTYTDSKYRYQFKYPRDWTLGPEPEALHSEILFSRLVYHPSDPTTAFNISVRTVFLDDYVSAMEAYATEPTVSITVDGIRGKKVAQQGADGKQYIIGVYVPFNDLTYDLSGYTENTLSARGKFVPIFEQILSTFEFLD